MAYPEGGREPSLRTKLIRKCGGWTPFYTAMAKFNRTKRNDPCPCGSGIKYKRCCLNKIQQVQRPNPGKIGM